jgi:hypothetical protein
MSFSESSSQKLDTSTNASLKTSSSLEPQSHPQGKLKLPASSNVVVGGDDAQLTMNLGASAKSLASNMASALDDDNEKVH